MLAMLLGTKVGQQHTQKQEENWKQDPPSDQTQSLQSSWDILIIKSVFSECKSNVWFANKKEHRTEIKPETNF